MSSCSISRESYTRIAGHSPKSAIIQYQDWFSCLCAGRCMRSTTKLCKMTSINAQVCMLLAQSQKQIHTEHICLWHKRVWKHGGEHNVPCHPVRLVWLWVSDRASGSLTAVRYQDKMDLVLAEWDLGFS